MNREAENEVIHRWQNHQSLRSIARELNLTRYQITRIIQSHTKQRDAQANSEHDSPPASLDSAPKRRSSKLDPFAEQITQLLECCPRITVKRVYEELSRGGYTPIISTPYCVRCSERLTITLMASRLWSGSYHIKRR